jgi:hypothetical protein
MQVLGIGAFRFGPGGRRERDVGVQASVRMHGVLPGLLDELPFFALTFSIRS